MKKKGGLGVGSLDAFNLGLLYKWKWRFFNEPSVLWVQLVKSLYGDGGGFHEVRSTNGCGVWSKIVGSINRLHDQHVVAASSMSRVLGDGQFISFWNDVWCGTDSLKSLFPRLFALSICPAGTVAGFVDQGRWVFHWRRPLRGGGGGWSRPNTMPSWISCSRLLLLPPRIGGGGL